MKKIKTLIAIGLIVLAGFSFTTCSWENPIMETWWIDEATQTLQNIRVINIEYVIFAGNQTLYNDKDSIPAGLPSTLTTAQQAYNTSIINLTAKLLKNNADYRVILHGHANPTIDAEVDPQGAEDEIEELMTISISRANNTAVALREEFVNNFNGSVSNINSRMRATGYGGGLNVTSAGDQPSLNRRVEVIVFTIDTQNK